MERWLKKGLLETLREVQQALCDLSVLPAFADDAPEFNDGGVGRIASNKLRRWLQAFDNLPEAGEELIAIENKHRDVFARYSTQVDWGTAVTPKEKWIDPVNKKYRTRGGKEIVGLEVVLYNSSGDEVTFPVKGSVVVKEKPLCLDYVIWKLDGRHSLFSETHLDLVEVKDE